MSVRGLTGGGLALAAVAVFWWVVNAPYAVAGLTATGTPWPISCAAAIVLPTAGLSCAQLLHRLDLKGSNTAGSRFFTILLLFVMAFGSAGVSYPVDNPGHLPWYLTAFIAAADVLVAYGFPCLIIALAHAKSERDAAAV